MYVLYLMKGQIVFLSNVLIGPILCRVSVVTLVWVLLKVSSAKTHRAAQWQIRGVPFEGVSEYTESLTVDHSV